MTLYGDSFGDQSLQTMFPVSATVVHAKYSWKQSLHQGFQCVRGMGFITACDSSSIARIRRTGEIYMGATRQQRYTCIDESFLSALQMNQWKRDHGITELIPIAVVYQE
jgi:hypothetical protein